jgi:hypothetical protein
MRFTLAIYAIATCIAINLCGCSWSKASITEGTFDVYAPAPYTGASFSMDEKSSVKRASVQVRKYDKETWQLHGLTNEEANTGGGGYKLEKSDANIAYRLLRFPVTGAFDYFSKNRISMWGLGFGLDPFPFIRASAGINSRFVEAGITAYLNLSMNSFSAKGKWISVEGTLAGDMDDYGDLDCNKCHETKFHGGFGGFLNLFPIKELALSYAPFLYKPWWDDEIQNRDISFEFPYIISQYFGASYLIAKHVQISAGTTIYLGKAFTGHYWFFDTGIGFVF